MKGRIALALLVCTTSAYAIFCPTGFTTINYGDTIDKVREVCGKPDTEHEFARTASTAQEWEYYVKLHNLDRAMAKMTVLLKDNKVVNINIVDDSFAHSQVCMSVQTGNRLGVVQSFCNKPGEPKNVSRTEVCGNTIQIDNSAQQVEFACGKPALTKDIQTESSQNPALVVTEYEYAGPPRVKLIFEDGKLKDRRFS
jgi:hypothetical protein